MRPCLRSGPIALCVLFVLRQNSAAAPPALPATTPACATDLRCRGHLAQAKELSQTGQPESALRELRQAYAVSADPRVLASIGLAQQKLGRYAEALVDYQQALAAVPPSDALHRELSLPIAETKAALHAAQPKAPSPTTAPVVPEDKPPQLTQNTQLTQATATAPVQINNSNQLSVQIAAPGSQPSEAANSPPAQRSGSSVHRWLWPTLGGVVASAGIAIGLAIALRPLTCEQGDACVGLMSAGSALTAFPSRADRARP